MKQIDLIQHENNTVSKFHRKSFIGVNDKVLKNIPVCNTPFPNFDATQRIVLSHYVLEDGQWIRKHVFRELTAEEKKFQAHQKELFLKVMTRD